MVKLKVARQRIRRRVGRCEGRKPFGHRPGEADTLDQIFTLRRKRPKRKAMSFAAIAEALNAAGTLSRTGKPWKPETVRGIIRRGRTTGKN